MGRVPATNDPVVKRRQRATKIAFVAGCGVPVDRIAVVIVDHPLAVDPVKDPNGPTSLFAEDLLAGVPGLRPHQIYTANVDPAVIEALRIRGFANAAHMCLCLYLDSVALLLKRMYDGAVLLDADVWGGYDTDARPVLKLALELGLLRPEGALVCFACSDLGERFHKRQASLRTNVHIIVDVERLCFDSRTADRHYECRAIEWPEDVPAGYARTMQTHGFAVRSDGQSCHLVPVPAASDASRKTECDADKKRKRAQ